MSKFLEKNKSNLEELNKIIDDNFDNIRRIITSTEIFCFLLDGGLINPVANDTIGKYKNITIISDPYYLSKEINFVFKDKGIILDVPCVCGIYSDEKHP